MTFSRALAFVLAAPALMGLAACGSSPTDPVTDGPRITSVMPQAPVQSDTPQLLIVRGDQFLSGLSLVVAAPDNSTRIHSNSDIEGLQQTTFHVFNKVGTYTLRASNPNGAGSNTVSLLVGQ